MYQDLTGTLRAWHQIVLGRSWCCQRTAAVPAGTPPVRVDNVPLAVLKGGKTDWVPTHMK